MGLTKLGTMSLTQAASSQSFDLNAIPSEEPGGISFLDDFIFHIDVTDADKGSGTPTIEQVHQMFQSVTCENAGGYWGPVGLGGDDLQAHRYYHTARPSMYCEAEGDTIPTGANALMQLVYKYSFGNFGLKRSDFSPAVRALQRGGRLTVAWGGGGGSAVISTLAATLTVYAKTFGQDEVRAVPRVITERVTLDRLEGGNVASGRLIGLMLKNGGDWVDGDITGYSLRADGVPVITDAELDVFLSEFPDIGLFADAALRNYSAGFDPIDGGGDPRYLPVYPLFPKGTPISQRLAAHAWTCAVRGSETAANMTHIVDRVQKMGAGEIIDQIGAITGNRAAVDKHIRETNGAALRYKTASKTTLTKENLYGYLPVKYLSDEGTTQAGL